MIKLYTILFIVFLLACHNSQKEADLKYRLEELKKENDELVEKLKNYGEVPHVKEDPIPENPAINSQSYAFVLLTVEQEEPKYGSPETDFKQTVLYNYCSGVQELAFVDNDVKYKLMDDVQQNYYQSKGQFHNGKVKSRQCFVFSSYEDASKKREEYLTKQ